MTESTPAAPALVVVLTPEGDGPELPERVTLLLKSALRRHRLRAVAVGEVGTGVEAQAVDVMTRKARRKANSQPAPDGKADLSAWLSRIGNGADRQ